MNSESIFLGFSKLSRHERFERLVQLGALTPEDVRFLESGAILDMSLADKFIENSIGYFQLPMGVACYFNIDKKDYVIPLAVEETSIIAALSKTAKWIRQSGSIETSIEGRGIVGQIQIAQVKNKQKLIEVVQQQKNYWLELVNQQVLASMVQRGGGAFELTLRFLPREDGFEMAVIHLLMESCDAMGANAINQALEFLKTPIEQMTQETVHMCILSNLNDQKITTARVMIESIDPILGEKIQEASLFAEVDPYRAATHNKGIMNGIDAVVIATGNDWRAIEAGAHAYAAREGRYQSLSRWRYANHRLVGELSLPLVVGTVGGVTSLHPTARIAHQILGVTNANELSRVIAAVGLVQNLGAIKALCTEGIIKGHMKLHIDNLILVSGAQESERELLKAKLQRHLAQTQRVSAAHAQKFLSEIRASHSA
jgi:hydroxymethylglutaryl-CoA reductase